MSGALQFSSGRQLGSAFVRVRPETSGFGANLAKQLQTAFKAPSFDSVFSLPSGLLDNVNTTGAAAAGHLERASRAATAVSSNITRAFGAPLALGAALVGKISAEFEYTLNTVRAVSGATREQAEALEEAARAAALGTKFTAQQVAEAQQFLALAGNDVVDILAALPDVLTLAAAGNLELGKAADIVTNIMAGQRRTIDQLSDSVDVLTATFTGSNTNLAQLGTAFSYVGPVAAEIGVQFEETSAALGLLGNAGIQACFDDQTEVLTTKGWLKWPEVKGDETFATVNSETNAVEYQEAVDYHRYPYTGPMYSVQTQMLDMVVTPNHKMYVQKRGHSGYELIEAQDIAGKAVRYKGSFAWDAPDVEKVLIPGFTQKRGSWSKDVFDVYVHGDDYARFMGYYLSEGSCDYRPDSGYRVALAQHKPTGCQDGMREVLENLPWAFTESPSGFVVHQEQLYRVVEPFGHAHEKYVSETIKGMSSRQIRLFLEAYIAGDGDCNNVIYTASSRMRDDLQHLAVLAGWTSKVTTKHKAGDKIWFARDNRFIEAKHDSWKVHIRKSEARGSDPWYDPSNYTNSRYELRKDAHIADVFEGFVDYEGYVYDVEVPNHILIVRRNGKIIASGNSKAGTTLRGALSKLVAPTRVGSKVLNELGVVTTDTNGALLPLVDILEQFEEKGLSAGQAIKIFGQRAGPGVLALVGQGSDALAKFTAELELAGGTAQEIADVQMEGLRGAFLVAKSQFEEFALAFAESGLSKTLETLVKSIGSFFERLSEDEALQSLIINLGKLVVLSSGVLRLSGALGGLASKLIGVRSAISAVSSLGGFSQTLKAATSSVDEFTASGVAAADASKIIEGNKLALRNAAAGILGVATVTAAAVAGGVYLWDQYTNKLSNVQEAAKAFGETLEQDLTGNFEGVAVAGEASIALIQEKLASIDTTFTATEISKLTRGIQGSSAQFQSAANFAGLFDAANSDARQSVEEIREAFLRAQAGVLAYNSSLGLAIDVNSAFRNSADSLASFLNLAAGAADNAKFSFHDLTAEVLSLTYWDTATNKVNRVREQFRNLNLELANSEILFTGTREEAAAMATNLALSSPDISKSIDVINQGLQDLQYFILNVSNQGKDLLGVADNLDQVEKARLLTIIGDVEALGGSILALEPDKLAELVGLLSQVGGGTFGFSPENIESIKGLSGVLDAIEGLFADKGLQDALDVAGISFNDFNNSLAEGNIEEAVKNIGKIKTNEVVEFPQLLEAITTSINTLDEASRSLFTESLVDSGALLGLSVPEQKKVFDELLATLPPYAEEAGRGVLYAMHNALRQGVTLPDDFLITELDRVLSESEKQYNSALAEILEPNESVFDGILRTLEEDGIDLRFLTQFETVEDALGALATSPHFAEFQTQLNALDPDILAEDFTYLKQIVDTANEAVVEFSNNLYRFLIPSLEGAFGDAQQSVLENFKTIIEETEGSTAKTAKQLELLGEDENIFTNLEVGLAAVNDELDKILEATRNRVQNFNILEDSGLFTAQEIQLYIERIAPSLPPGVSDSILQAVADDLKDGDIDSNITRELQELIGTELELGEITVGAQAVIDSPERLFTNLTSLGDELFVFLRNELSLTPEQIVELTSAVGDSIRESVENSAIVLGDDNTSLASMPDSFFAANDLVLFENEAAVESEIQRQLEAVFDPNAFQESIAALFKLDPDNPTLAAAYAATAASTAEAIIPDREIFISNYEQFATDVEPAVSAAFESSAKTSGSKIGTGLIAGLRATEQSVLRAHTVLAVKIANVYDSVWESSSPSRLAMRKAAFFVDGLTEGIRSNESNAIEAAKTLAKGIADVPMELADIRVQAAKIEPGFRSPQQVTSVDVTGNAPAGGGGNNYFNIENFNTAAASSPEGAALLLSEALKNLEAS